MKKQVLKSLESISTFYSVFEKDQVLTHDQLNSVTEYLDDATRLSRIHLTGVGIVCGLRVTRQGNLLRLSRGLGLTSDGDLAALGSETAFDRFKKYDDTNPQYDPFLINSSLMELFELVPSGTVDKDAASLNLFTAVTDRDLSDMAALLLVESLITDDDLCTATDCDNLGQDCRHTVKLLLLDKASAATLAAQNPAVPAGAFAQLEEIILARPLLGTATTSTGAVATKYREVCNTMHSRLLKQLELFYPACAAFLAPHLPNNPTPAWKNSLEAIKSSFATTETGIQYYYDFLLDLAVTYNSFRDLLFGDATLCCPAPDSFPKHLLLGNVEAAADSSDNRTSFFPSPAGSRTSGNLDHALFLLKKIDTLILSFKIPAAAEDTVRVTPSLCRAPGSEQGAIPYYYRINDRQPLQDGWNYSLFLRQAGNTNYSYRAAAKIAGPGYYAAKGAAAAPLAAHIGAFDFFRIEGHLGKKADEAADAIEELIKTFNLPFSVVAVMLDTDRKKIIKRPPPRYTDLHRFHYLLRQDLSQQLDETSRFSGNFLGKMDGAAEEKDGATLKELATQKHNRIVAKTADAKSKLDRSYRHYKKDPSWKIDLGDTMQAAGEFKFNAGKVVKTEFNTPFDSIISLSRGHWLEWLDTLLDKKEEKEDDKLLFANFLATHPGLEHAGGVSRGGTFVLGYNAAGIVMYDFMLPYCCCEAADSEEEEPALPKPGWRPPFVIDEGIRILPSIDRKLDTFQLQIEPIWQEKFDLKNNFFQTFKDSVEMMGQVYTTVDKGAVAGAVDAGYADHYLEVLANAARSQKEMVGYYNAQAANPAAAEEERTKAAAKAKQAEEAVAAAVKETVDYVARENKEVKVGSEGYRAMMEISKSMEVVTNEATASKMRSDVQEVAGKVSNNDALRNILNDMVRTR